MFNIFQEPPGLLIARVLGILFAIPFHEVAHAWISNKLGDSTARDLGRLTLNPIKHLDPWGLVAMLTIGIGWAKPVPINPNRYKNPKYGMAISAAAGPISNLLLAYVFMLLYKAFTFGFALYNIKVAQLLQTPTWFEISSDVMYYFIIINISLAVFNMLPIPPFDGSRIFGLFLPNRIYFAIQKYEKHVMIAVLILMFIVPRLTPYDPLGWLLQRGTSAIFNALLWATGYVESIFKWLVLR